jgi:hypothetical protein
MRDPDSKATPLPFLPPDMARAMMENGEGKKQTQKVLISRSKEPFVIVPQSHLELLATCKSSAAFAIYHVLYLTWCGSLRKYNPVKLNVGRLLRWGYCHRTIYRALNTLERCGLIQVTHKPGSSPVVFLKWLDRRERN